MKTIIITKKFWGAFSTIIVVGLLFAYYLMIYVPKKEGEINARKFRTLQRSGENIQSMKIDYEEAVKQMLGEYIGQIQTCRAKAKEAKKLTISDAHYFDKLLQISGDCISKNKNYLDDQFSSLKIKLEPLSRDIYDQLGNEVSLNEAHVAQPSYIFFNIKEGDPFSAYADTYPRLKVSDFLGDQNLLESDFNRVLIIRNFRIKRAEEHDINVVGVDPETQAIRCCKENRSDSSYSVIAYQKSLGVPIGADNNIDIANIKELVENSFGLTSIPVRDVSVGGTSYRLYGQRISFDENEDWIICGLMKTRDFKSQARSVHLMVIIFSVLILLFVLLAMPILKLLVMSDIERLRISNVWFSGFAIVIGTTLVLYILLGANHYFAYEVDNDKKLRKLSNSIDHKFNLEIDSIQKQLISWSKFENFEKKSNPSGKDQSFKVVDNVLTNSDGKDKFLTYPFFNEVMWMDSMGDQKITYTTHPMNVTARAPNLSNRKYFSKPRDGTFTTSDSPGFYLESIFSWRSRLHEAGLGMRMVKGTVLQIEGKNNFVGHRKGYKKDSINLEVMAMATKLHSVMDPLLPVGYQFCIISEQGEVLFHSNKNRNNQEDLFSETENDNELKAAVQGRIEKFISLNYGQSPQRVHVKPLKSMPFYLVTMHDRDHYKSPVILTMGFAGILMAILFLLQGSQILLLFITTYRPTRLKIKRFFMNWLRPIKVDTNSNVESKLTYFKATCGMVLMTLILALISYLFFALYLVILFWLVPVLILLFNYLLLQKLNRKESTDDFWKKSTFTGTSIVLIVFITTGSYFFLPSGSFIWLLTGELAFAGFLYLIYFRSWVPTRITEKLQAATLGKLYIIFLLSWLFLVGVLPVFYFYKVSYYREMSVWVRYTQWQALQDRLAREIDLKDELGKLGLFDKKDTSVKLSMI